MATFTFYNLWKEAQLDGNLADTPIDFDNDVLKLALVTDSYSPSQAHTVFGDASANEVSGTNYTAGGDVVTVTVTETGGTVTVDGSDITWNQSGGGFIDARYAIFYKDATTDPLVGYIDFTADKGNVSGDLTVQWSGSGIYTMA